MTAGGQGVADRRMARVGRHVLVAGGSRGIGRAVALACAAPGTTLHLSARERGALLATAEDCRRLGATVAMRPLDVRDRDGMRRWIESVGRLDFVLASAGTAAGCPMTGPESADAARTIFETNVTGMLNTVLPAIEVMRGQDPVGGVRGRIAAMASVAGFVAVPAAAAYCASKAAVDHWMVGQAHVARAQGVGLTSVCPGYVRTRMTEQNAFRMPGLMEPEDAAARLLAAVARGRVRAVFPWWMGIAGRIGATMPAGTMGRMLGGQSVVPGMADLPDRGVAFGPVAPVTLLTPARPRIAAR